MSMTREVIVVFDENGKAIYWHDQDASSGYVPDADDLFYVLWEHKDHLGGFAHTHPWDGPAAPSGIDLTTYAALEKGLGKHLLWPVVTFTDLVCVVRNPIFNEGGAMWTLAGPLTIEFDWIDELRRRSGSDSSPAG